MSIHIQSHESNTRGLMDPACRGSWAAGALGEGAWQLSGTHDKHPAVHRSAG